MNSARNGDEKRTAGKPPADRERQKGGGPDGGVTRITDDNDPIAEALRRVYNDAATEPLPDDLSRLLSQLEAAEKDA